MSISILQRPTAAALATDGAAWVAAFLRTTVAVNGQASFAVSGGRTPGMLFVALAELDVPWDHVHILQVDERLAPDRSPDRNLTGLKTNLTDHIPIPARNVHPMRVAPDMTPTALAQDYARVLDRVAPDGIDLVQLGLGDDGHTASLVPSDAALDVNDRRVTFTGRYNDYLRLTFTFAELKRSKAIVWLVTGEAKAARVRQLLDGDVSIPAGRIRHGFQTLLVDAAAAAEVSVSTSENATPTTKDVS